MFQINFHIWSNLLFEKFYYKNISGNALKIEMKYLCHNFNSNIFKVTTITRMMFSKVTYHSPILNYKIGIKTITILIIIMISKMAKRILQKHSIYTEASTINCSDSRKLILEGHIEFGAKISSVSYKRKC